MLKIPIILKYTYLHYRIALTQLYGVGPVRAKEILNGLNDLDELFFLSPVQLEKRTGFHSNFFRKMNREAALDNSDMILNFHQKRGMNTLFYTDEEYPRRLNNCVDAPLLLYKNGSVNFNNSKIVAIVGTRSATSYGEQLCRDLIHSFRDNNIIVVSGLAFGIDACVHRQCLENEVPTIGVLGHGLDKIYPSKHKKMAEEIVGKGGAILTEYIPGTQPERVNFPMRNRIVAGMCDATIVVESKKSGGSLITANIANDYNRDVFAFPGNVNTETSQGCNLLIGQQKAHLIQSPAEFLEMMNWNNDQMQITTIQKKLFPELSEQQQSIMTIISDSGELHIDALSCRAGMTISQLNIELFYLEMEGLVISSPGKKYKLG